jgi:putative oxidoreductase
MQPYGPAVLRVAIGAVFVAHGGQKLFGIWGGGGLAATSSFFGQLGLTPSYPLAIVVGLVEFAGGLMLIAGAATLYVALALAVNMVVATWKVHLANGFFLNWNMVPGQGHGYEFNLALLGALVSLMLTGPGAFSVDGRRARSAEAEAYGRARLRAGKV